MKVMVILLKFTLRHGTPSALKTPWSGESTATTACKQSFTAWLEECRLAWPRRSHDYQHTPFSAHLLTRCPSKMMTFHSQPLLGIGIHPDHLPLFII